MRDTGRKWGIALNQLQGDDLFLVPPQYNSSPAKTFSLYDKFASYRHLIEEDWSLQAPWGTDENSIDQTSRYLPVDPYFNNFTFDELAKYTFANPIESNVSLLFERHTRFRNHNYVPPEPFEFVYKLRNSLHHYGSSYPYQWNSLVQAYYAIPDFDFGPGFEVRFDHSSYFNEWGTAQHSHDTLIDLKKEMPYGEFAYYYGDNVIYLDGIFAYLIYYKGKHVLTISFSVGDGKIFINQVQLRQAKGNRWLYNLPVDLLTYATACMYQHFDKWGFDVYLVEGGSLAKRISKVHSDLPKDVQDRITRFYNQPLTGYCRGPEYKKKYFTFFQVQPC